MKTDISIPDPLFQAAEALARRLRLSHSELYARAMEAYVSHFDEAAITRRLNDLYADDPAWIDAQLAAAQAVLLTNEGW